MSSIVADQKPYRPYISMILGLCLRPTNTSWGGDRYLKYASLINSSHRTYVFKLEI